MVAWQQTKSKDSRQPAISHQPSAISHAAAAMQQLSSHTGHQPTSHTGHVANDGDNNNESNGGSGGGDGDGDGDGDSNLYL